jgi:hypothetical protein
MGSSHEGSWWIENATKNWGLFPLYWLKYQTFSQLSSLYIENSEMYRITGTKSAVGGCFAFLLKEQLLHVRYGHLLQANLPPFHNPNKVNRVIRSTHNQMSHCYLLGVYTSHLTYRSFPKIAPHCCNKAWCFQLLQHTHQNTQTQVC